MRPAQVQPHKKPVDVVAAPQDLQFDVERTRRRRVDVQASGRATDTFFSKKKIEAARGYAGGSAIHPQGGKSHRTADSPLRPVQTVWAGTVARAGAAGEPDEADRTLGDHREHSDEADQLVDRGQP